LALHAFVFAKPNVRVQWMVIHGHHAEQVVIKFSDRLAGPMFEHVASIEFLVITAEGAVIYRHGSLFLGFRSSFLYRQIIAKPKSERWLFWKRWRFRIQVQNGATKSVPARPRRIAVEPRESPPTDEMGEDKCIHNEFVR
jgi:hypothetical protein